MDNYSEIELEVDKKAREILNETDIDVDSVQVLHPVDREGNFRIKISGVVRDIKIEEKEGE